MLEVARFNREHERAMQRGGVSNGAPNETTLMAYTEQTLTLERQQKRAEGEFIRQ